MGRWKRRGDNNRKGREPLKSLITVKGFPSSLGLNVTDPYFQQPQKRQREKSIIDFYFVERIWHVV